MSFSPDAAPLAAAAAAAANGVDKEFSSEYQSSSINHRRHRRRRRCLVCCGACAAVAVVVAVVIIIIALTVYKVREPVMSMNSVVVQNLDLASSSAGRLKANITVAADVSVKNPNAVTFKFGPSATAVYYRGREVGEALAPPGIARARRTVRMNVSVDVMADRLITDRAFLADIAFGSVGVSTSTSVGGRVRIFGIVRHHVDVVMNCSFTVAIPAMAVQNQSCSQHFSL